MIQDQPDSGDLVETPGDMLDNPDIELITDYLTDQLPPDRITEVERRLIEDDAFRELAEPLFVAWSVPPRWKREPMSRAHLARMWDDFAGRVGALDLIGRLGDGGAE